MDFDIDNCMHNYSRTHERQRYLYGNNFDIKSTWQHVICSRCSKELGRVLVASELVNHSGYSEPESDKGSPARFGT